MLIDEVPHQVQLVRDEDRRITPRIEAIDAERAVGGRHCVEIRARFDDLEEALEKARIHRVTLSDQEPCRTIDGVKLCVLYPPPDGVDDTSVVLRLEFGKVRVLFAGALE